MGRGRLVVFEGPEGAGKTTQLRRLADRLARSGIRHLVVREPGQTPVGDEIRRLVLGSDLEMSPRTEALLFMASRAELVATELRPAVDEGRWVLADRFFLSTYAYQCGGRGLPEDEVRAANRLATGGLRPDLTVLLEFPPDEGLARADARGGRDRIERTGSEFHDRVAAAFAEFARPEWQAAHPECGPIVSVDARGTPDDVAAHVMAVLDARWPGTFGG